jgi:2'-5' RNA ligase
MRSPNFFFLLLSPPIEVIDYVAELKQLVCKTLGHSFDSLHSIAHLTLLQYYDFHNESLLYVFNERISKFKSFTVYVKDFDIFMNNGTVYLNAFALELDSLAKQLTDRSFKPHITIAKNLSPRDTNLAWGLLKNFRYTNSFKCEYVTVLKRVSDRWQPHLDLPLA